jgi:hypothetical protein
MRKMGVRGLLIYCADYRCSHSVATDRWPDDLRLSDIGKCGEPWNYSEWSEASARSEHREAVATMVQIKAAGFTQS